MELLLSVEPLLHAGHEHPATLWIAVSAVVSFALGVGVGVFGTGRFGTDAFETNAAANTRTDPETEDDDT